VNQRLARQLGEPPTAEPTAVREIAAGDVTVRLTER
jgi:hypothetical protein